MDKNPDPGRRGKDLRSRLREAEERAARFEEAHEALQAISRGEVEAVVVSTDRGDRVFTLQGADRSYHILVEAMAEGMATVTKEGLILYGNKAFSRMAEAPLEKVIGASILDFVPEADKARFKGLLEGGLRSAGRETSLRTAQGAALPVSLSISPLPESDPPAFCLVVTDLTEQKKAETELERNRRHLEALVARRTIELERLTAQIERERDNLKTLVECIPDEIWYIDANRNLSLVNPGSIQCPGSEGKNGGRALEEVLAELEVLRSDGSLRPKEEMPLVRSLKGETLSGEESARHLGTGELRYRRYRSSPVRDRQGHVSGAVAVVSDITESKRMEEALRRSRQGLEERVRERTAELVKANAALRETTRTLEELVRVSPVGITVLDSSGKVLLWNPAMERIFGWTEGEVRGRLVPTVAAGQKGAKKTLERLLAGEMLAGIEMKRVRKDGRPVDLRLWTASIREGDGYLRSIVEIVVDVTKLKELERIALIQEKMASLGHMAAGIAHEIRNPLSGLNIYLSSLEKVMDQSVRLEPEVRETMRKILGMTFSASSRIDGIIRRVLDFSRPGLPRREPLSVNTCIREAVALVRVVLGKSGIQLKLALDEVLPECLGDRRLIEQVFLNLLTNAVKAVEGTVGEKAIEVSSSRQNGYVHMAVADSGPGVPERFREKIFESFFAMRPGGTGIGLSLSQKIVSDHGGFIRVGTSRWGGALFTVGLPMGDREEIPAV